MTIKVNFICQLSSNFSPFVDWKNVQRTLAIQNERLLGRRSRGGVYISSRNSSTEGSARYCSGNSSTLR